MKVEMNVSGLNGVLQTLQSLPPEIVSAKGGPVKNALRKAAQVIQKQAKANVRAIVAEPNKDGRPTQSTGALEKAITVTRGKMRGTVKGEKYLVRVPHKLVKYANTKKNQRLGRVGKYYKQEPPTYYGRMLEYGTSKMRPHPWLRPAVEQKGAEAIQVFTDDLNKSIDATVKKLAQQNKAK